MFPVRGPRAGDHLAVGLMRLGDVMAERWLVPVKPPVHHGFIPRYREAAITFTNRTESCF